MKDLTALSPPQSGNCHENLAVHAHYMQCFGTLMLPVVMLSLYCMQQCGRKQGLDVYLPVKIHNCQLSIDYSSWKDKMKMIPLMETPVFSIWNSRYYCDQIGLFEVLNNRMLGFWVVLFGARLWQILLCLVTSLISRFVFSSSSSLTVMLAFSENCDMLCTAEGLKPAPGALLGWTVCVCVCSVLLLK